jgi:hypothetical protein
MPSVRIWADRDMWRFLTFFSTTSSINNTFFHYTAFRGFCNAPYKWRSGSGE